MATAMLLAGVSTVRAQSVRIVSDAVVDATPGRAVLEPHLAIDPRDPNHLIAAAMVVPPFGASIKEQRCTTFASFDGGAHWSSRELPIVECYDPWLSFLPDGGAIFSTLGGDPILAGEGNGLLVYRSRDGGRTWLNRPAGLSWGWDHPMTVVDLTASKRRGWIYMVSSRDLRRNGSGDFAVSVSRSIDGGKSFDAPRNIAPEGQTIKAEPPVVLSDGTLIVPYVEVAEAGVLLERRRAWVARSSNGMDFSRPAVIGQACGSPPSFLMSSFAVDASGGRFQDRLYFSCTLGGFTGIAVSHSSDLGATWSNPVVAAGNAADGTTSRSLMASAVSSTGVFGVLWLAHRSAATNGCRDVYFSASFDGGETFAAPVRVSQQSSCPNGKLNGPNGSYGDYFALAGDSRGRFRAAWVDARTGLFQLRTALIAVDASGR